MAKQETGRFDELTVGQSFVRQASFVDGWQATEWIKAGMFTARPAGTTDSKQFSVLEVVKRIS